MGNSKPLSTAILLVLALSTQCRTVHRRSYPKVPGCSRTQSSVPGAALVSLKQPAPSTDPGLDEIIAQDILVGDPEAETFSLTSGRLISWFLTCPCSPSGRGASPDVTARVQAILNNATGPFEKELNGSPSRLDALDKIFKIVAPSVRAASETYGDEAVINADFKLRGEDKLSICTYDRDTKRNVRFINGISSGKPIATTIGKCNTVPQFTSKSQNLEQETDSAPAGSAPHPISGPRNEGCVAVEHLKGYVLQHESHLLRPVLCSRGFCATPNHGIFVDGKYTSMKKLCSDSTWRCTRQTKLVNNLKLAANNWAVVSDSIVVTPYDVRFPKAAIWAVQMLEDILNLVVPSVAYGSVATVTFVVLQMLYKSFELPSAWPARKGEVLD